MKLLPAAVLALLAAAAASAQASPTFLIDFERQWDYANGDVNGYYAGGTAADGATGPNLGISFVGVSGLSNDADFTYYTGAPSPLGTAYAHTEAAGDRAFMNVAAGVDNGLSFFYSTPLSVTGAVRAYAGLNGTGALLGSFDLPANASGVYDAWTAATFTFGGTARSFDLTGGANLVALDNLRSVSPVPEPGSVLMLLVGGVALAGRAARNRRA